MNIREKSELNFEILIQLFEKNLPIQFRKKWEHGKYIGGRRRLKQDNMNMKAVYK